MQLDEAKQILNSIGYLLEDKFDDDPITVDYIDQDNYKDYIGKFVNVRDYVILSNLKLTKLPIKFGVVGGDFYCELNKLKSLKGAPIEVKGNFICDYNELTTLKDSPKKVKGCFVCDNNKLTSLEGSPEEVGNYFTCENNKLTSLEGAPETVGDSFLCGNNPLTSLKGAPKYVGKNFLVGKTAAMFTKDDVREVSNVEDDICGTVDSDFYDGDDEDLDESFDRVGKQVCIRVELNPDYCPEELIDYPILWLNPDGSINFKEVPKFMDVSVAEEIISNIDWDKIEKEIADYYDTIQRIKINDIYISDDV